MDKYVKSRFGAPKRFFEAEAIGLNWIDVDGGPKVAKVFDYDNNSLTIERINETNSSPEKAFEFGKKLAKLHQEECPGFGYSPSKNAYFGPLSDPLPGVNKEYPDFWSYFIEGRIEQMGRYCVDRHEMSIDALKGAIKIIETLNEKLPDLKNAKPSRVHGDLWSGNLLWAENEAVLIDPSAHAGNFEEDLAMLNLFGCSYYSDIIAGYSEVKELSPDFKLHAILHNLYPILGHVAFFGGGYLSQFNSMLNQLNRI